MRLTIVVSFVAALWLAGGALHAQIWHMPADSERCPSKWGAGNQRGSGNSMKPAMVLRATKLIRSGRLECGAGGDPISACYRGRNAMITSLRLPW